MKRVACLLALCALFPAGSRAQPLAEMADDAPFAGEWRNPLTSLSTGMLTSVIITKRDGQWFVRGWGESLPWGERPLRVSRKRSASGGFEGVAMWDKGRVYPVDQVYFSVKDDRLVVEVRRIFKDGQPICDWTGYFVRVRN